MKDEIEAQITPHIYTGVYQDLYNRIAIKLPNEISIQLIENLNVKMW